jgi:enoyl-CoA hydratase/carnithine racemase
MTSPNTDAATGDTSATAPITLERRGPLAIATISAPPLNLMDQQMLDALVSVLDAVEADLPRALLFRAEGKIWTGGVDVEMFSGRTAATGADLWNAVLSVAQRVEALPLPTLLSAHSLCLTWGFELALACDLLIAGERAKFGLVEAVVGLTPSMGGVQRLAARAGSARAREFVMTGDPYDAATMRDWGVVNWLFPEGDLEQETLRIAERLANGPTVAHSATKQLVKAVENDGVAAADALVPDVCGALFETEDLQNAVRTFLEHGPGHATFEGR